MPQNPTALRSISALAAAAALAITRGAHAAEFPYRVLHRIPLAGPHTVRALAFGPQGARVYAAVGDELRSFDVPSARPGREVTLAGSVVALASAGTAGMLYAAIGKPARLVILKLRPLRIIASVPLRDGAPSGLLYDPIAQALYAESRSGHTITRLDPESGRRMGSVHLRGRLEQMAANGRATVYVADSSADDVDVIDAATMRELGAIPTPDCTAPTGLALDPMGRRLFVACGNGKALVIDTDMGFTFEQLPIGRGSALRAVFALHPSATGGWKGGTFIAGNDSRLDGIRMMAFIKYVRGGGLPLAAPCTAIALSPASGALWLALARPGRAPGRRPAGAEIWALGAATPGEPQ